MGERELTEALHWQYHFDAATYAEEIREDLPVTTSSRTSSPARAAPGARRILELGTGTGETARRLLARHPDASLVGIDENEQMLAVAQASRCRRAGLAARRPDRGCRSRPARSTWSRARCACTTWTAPAKADLFSRVRDALAPDGLFVLGDVVVPADPALATTPLTPGYDHPSPLADQLRWLAEAGLEPRVVWETRRSGGRRGAADLTVDRPSDNVRRPIPLLGS